MEYRLRLFSAAMDVRGNLRTASLCMHTCRIELELFEHSGRVPRRASNPTLYPMKLSTPLRRSSYLSCQALDLPIVHDTTTITTYPGNYPENALNPRPPLGTTRVI